MSPGLLICRLDQMSILSLHKNGLWRLIYCFSVISLCVAFKVQPVTKPCPHYCPNCRSFTESVTYCLVLVAAKAWGQFLQGQILPLSREMQMLTTSLGERRHAARAGNFVIHLRGGLSNTFGGTSAKHLKEYEIILGCPSVSGRLCWEAMGRNCEYSLPKQEERTVCCVMWMLGTATRVKYSRKNRDHMVEDFPMRAHPLSVYTDSVSYATSQMESKKIVSRL